MDDRDVELLLVECQVVGVDFHREGLVVAALIACLVVQAAQALDRLPMCLPGGGIQRGGDVSQIQVRQLAVVEPQQLRGGVIEVEQLACGVGPEHTDIRPVDGVLCQCQTAFDALAFGDVGGDAAHRIGLAPGVEQRKLGREVVVHAVAMWCAFVDGDRSAACQHLEVGVTGRLGDAFGEQLVVVFANDLLTWHLDEAFVAAVYQQILSRWILDVNDCGCVVDDRL